MIWILLIFLNNLLKTTDNFAERFFIHSRKFHKNLFLIFTKNKFLICSKFYNSLKNFTIQIVLANLIKIFIKLLKCFLVIISEQIELFWHHNVNIVFKTYVCDLYGWVSIIYRVMYFKQHHCNSPFGASGRCTSTLFTCYFTNMEHFNTHHWSNEREH